MEQKINEIKNILQAASIDELPAFIESYGKDVRAGVQTLVQKAQKQWRITRRNLRAQKK